MKCAAVPGEAARSIADRQTIDLYRLPHSPFVSFRPFVCLSLRQKGSSSVYNQCSRVCVRCVGRWKVQHAWARPHRTGQAGASSSPPPRPLFCLSNDVRTGSSNDRARGFLRSVPFPNGHTVRHTQTHTHTLGLVWPQPVCLSSILSFTLRDQKAV